MELIGRRAQVGDQTIFTFFLFLLIILAVGIVGGVFLFFGPNFDYRQAEADVLSLKVSECMGNNEINPGFWNDFYNICRLNKEVLEENKFMLKVCNGNNIDGCIE